MSKDMDRLLATLERLLQVADEPKTTEHVEPIAYSIEEAVRAGGGAISRAGIYRAATRGEVQIHKKGKRSYLLANDFKRWLEESPVMESGGARKYFGADKKDA